MSKETCHLPNCDSLADGIDGKCWHHSEDDIGGAMDFIETFLKDLDDSRKQPMKPFEAIKEAISEVFGPETQEWEKRDILVGSEEWLRDEHEHEHIIASVLSEHGLSPEEPYSLRGPSTHDKWEKVSEIASEKVGRKIYWESINPGKFQFQFVEVLNHDES